MPMIAVAGGTPYYVLMDGNRRIGPKVVQSRTGTECSAIYGFAGKSLYDKFCAQSQQTLMPYPLLKGYLRNHIGSPGDDVELVVLDAAGPGEPFLHAATMAAVLEAQEKRTPHVTAAFRLIFDQQAHVYRVEA